MAPSNCKIQDGDCKIKKKRRFFRQELLWLLIPIPAVLGLVGFLGEGESFWNAAFKCLTLYVMEYGDSTGNVLVQVARWLAPAATVSGLTMVFASIRKYARLLYARCSKKSVAVFGAEGEKQALLAELGRKGVPMDTAAVRAGSYILVGTEEENLEFYRQNAAAMAGKDVYLKCSALPEQVSDDPNLHLFSPEETSARLFWKENCPYALSKENDHRMKIVILGFGRIGRELIVQGLQYNIFDPGQRIEYHIFGEEEGFSNTHPQLPEITDPVVFHSESWYSSAALVQECQMLIVVEQEKQLELLRELTALLPNKTVHVFSAQTRGVELLGKNTGIMAFDWYAESMCLENIRGARTHYLAKKLNLQYAHLYSGVPETEENMEREWMNLNAFTRYSNISSANFHDVCMHILEGKELTEERLIFLGELEHIRWSRYHYLNNWKYGIPENGKMKDPQNRIHALLVPNDRLSEEEREKDRENIRMLMALRDEK